MKVTRIALYAVLLFLLQIGAAALLTTVIGPNMATMDDILMRYGFATFVAIGLFALMTWACSTRPYASAFLVGLLATALGIFGTSFVLGYVYWDPASLMFDVPVLLIAVLIGVQLGLWSKQRVQAKE